MKSKILLLPFVLLISSCTNSSLINGSRIYDSNTISSNESSLIEDNHLGSTVSNNIINHSSENSLSLENNTSDIVNEITYDFLWKDDNNADFVIFNNGIEVERIPAIKSIEIKTEASCLVDGLEEITMKATYNGIEYKDSIEKNIEATGHIFSEWKKVKNPTHFEEGLETRSCSKCDACEEKTINKLDDEETDLIYELKDNKEYIVKGTKNAVNIEQIVIPTTYNDLAVTEINIADTLNDNSENLIHNIYLPNSKLNIKSGLVFSSLDKDILSYHRINIYFDGTIQDWINNISLTNSRPFQNSIVYLHLKNGDSYERLNNLIIPEGIENIPANQFHSIQFVSLQLPQSLKTIGNNAFFNNKYLDRVIFNEGLEKIGIGAFTGCSSLKEVNLPGSITSAKSAFIELPNLMSVTIQSGASGINSTTFMECPKLVKVLNYSAWNLRINDNDYITINNQSYSFLFSINDFYFAKLDNELYFVNYCGNNSIVDLPMAIEFDGQVFISYKIRKNAFQCSFPLTSSPIDIDKTIEFYGGIDAIKMEKDFFVTSSIIRTIYLNANISDIGTNALTDNLLIKEVYFNGSEDQWLSLSNCYVPSLNRDMFTGTSLDGYIFIKNSINEYQKYDYSNNCFILD